MWTLIRAVALAVAVLVLLLAAGQGEWLVVVADRAGRVLGRDPILVGSSPAARAVLAGGALGMLVGLGAPRVVAQLATVLHELGHTVTSAALGARPSGIVLRHDASGHATARWTARPGGVRRLSLAVTAFVGLPAPAVAAAAGAEVLLLAGHRPVLIAATVAAGVVALLARSAWSLLVALVLGALGVAGLTEAGAPWAAGATVAVLVALAVHVAVDGVRRLGRPIAPGDDAAVVRGRVGVPAGLARLLQVVVVVAASGRVAWVLLDRLGWVPSLS